MFNTTQMISQMVSNTQTHVTNNSVQDIQPISEALQTMIVSFNKRIVKGLEFHTMTEEALCRCAYCGFLATAKVFVRFWTVPLRVSEVEGCPRCSSKAIFLETEKKEKKPE